MRNGAEHAVVVVVVVGVGRQVPGSDPGFGICVFKGACVKPWSEFRLSWLFRFFFLCKLRRWFL